MRIIALMMLLGAVLLAQAPVAPGAAGQDTAAPAEGGQKDQAGPPRPQYLENPEAWRKFWSRQGRSGATIRIPAGRDGQEIARLFDGSGVRLIPETEKVCAVPLTNVLPRGTNPDPRILKRVPPPPPERYHTREVAPPAPSCDDVK